jgi:hypothetical protein
MRFKPSIPVFEGAETVHALDRAATVIGGVMISDRINFVTLRYFLEHGLETRIRFSIGAVSSLRHYVETGSMPPPLHRHPLIILTPFSSGSRGSER